jgi:hypothetical protein
MKIQLYYHYIFYFNINQNDCIHNHNFLRNYIFSILFQIHLYLVSNYNRNIIHKMSFILYLILFEDQKILVILNNLNFFSRKIITMLIILNPYYS